MENLGFRGSCGYSDSPLMGEDLHGREQLRSRDAFVAASQCGRGLTATRDDYRDDHAAEFRATQKVNHGDSDSGDR